MHLEPSGWRLRCRAAGRKVDFRTGLHRIDLATAAAKEHLTGWQEGETARKRGGGSLEALAAVYLDTPKRTAAGPARDNVSRLRSVCRIATGRELDAVTCREVGPELWERYQRARFAELCREFDLTTRYRENVAINAAVRAARCLFIASMLPHYRRAGLDVPARAGDAVMLPEPYVPPADADDVAIAAAWRALPAGSALWLTIGLARFAGLRREEISACRKSWIVDGCIVLRDRPEESWWTKTGKPYRAQITDPDLAAYLASADGDRIVPDPPGGEDRGRWFERVPQAWLRPFMPGARKPLHRLRGLYADELARLTADAVAARLAGVKAAQQALGHTTMATTERHYLSE